MSAILSFASRVPAINRRSQHRRRHRPRLNPNLWSQAVAARQCHEVSSSLGDQSDALGATHPRRRRPRALRPCLLARLFGRAQVAHGVCISGGGCVAYYPTDVPFHHRSTWLGNRDVLGELVTGCRKLGMSVLIWHRSARYLRRQGRASRPIAEANGEPRRHWSSPEMWVTGAFGSVQSSIS